MTMKKLLMIAMLTAVAASGFVLAACGDSKPAQDPSSVGGGDGGTTPTTTDTSTAPTSTGGATGGDGG
jgi:ABC-type oligopeptide transport system substrate-binding subunit